MDGPSGWIFRLHNHLETKFKVRLKKFLPLVEYLRYVFKKTPEYSSVPNKRVGWNKRVGGKIR